MALFGCWKLKIPTLYNFLDMSVHGGSFMSSFVKSGAVNCIPNLRIASCSIDIPFLERFDEAKKLNESDSTTCSDSDLVFSSACVVPFVPFFSVSPFFSDSPFSPFFSVA